MIIFRASHVLSMNIVLLLDGNSEIGCRKEQSLLFDLFKAFDYFERIHILDIFSPKLHFLFVCAQYALSYHLL